MRHGGIVHNQVDTEEPAQTKSAAASLLLGAVRSLLHCGQLHLDDPGRPVPGASSCSRGANHGYMRIAPMQVQFAEVWILDKQRLDAACC